MAEFKFVDELTFEIASLGASGNNLAKDFSDIETGDIATLQTSMRYVQQQKDIRDLLRLYGELLRKDSNDLFIMEKNVNLMDQKVAAASK